MVPVMLVLGVACGGTLPQQMETIVADRLQRLDRLVIEVTAMIYTAPEASSPLDRSRWERFSTVPASRRVTIVRPDMLDEDFRDDPERGYEPVVNSVADGRFVMRHVRPARRGETVYSVVEHGVQCGYCASVPLLQFFDIHIQDSTIPQLNLLRLFREHEVQLIGAVGEISTYHASVRMQSYIQHFDFDLNSRGTPLRFRSVIEYPSTADRPLKPATWEMHTLATREVNGAQLVTEAVATIYNPNVLAEFTLHHYGVHHFVVNSVAMDDSLTADAVRIEPRLQNARVHTARADGMTLHRAYDDRGTLIEEDVTCGPRPLERGESFSSRDSLRWRVAVPIGASVAAVAGFVALRFVARRSQAPV